MTASSVDGGLPFRKFEHINPVTHLTLFILDGRLVIICDFIGKPCGGRHAHHLAFEPLALRRRVPLVNLCAEIYPASLLWVAGLVGILGWVIGSTSVQVPIPRETRTSFGAFFLQKYPCLCAFDLG